MSLVSSLFRNLLDRPGGADFRDSAGHFVRVMREHGIGLTWGRDELLFLDDLVARLKGHDEYRDAVGCYFGELLVRNFGGEWVPGHALGPAIRVATAKGVKHLFPLGWVYRRAARRAAPGHPPHGPRELPLSPAHGTHGSAPHRRE